MGSKPLQDLKQKQTNSNFVKNRGSFSQRGRSSSIIMQHTPEKQNMCNDFKNIFISNYIHQNWTSSLTRVYEVAEIDRTAQKNASQFTNNNFDSMIIMENCGQKLTDFILENVEMNNIKFVDETHSRWSDFRKTPEYLNLIFDLAKQ